MYEALPDIYARNCLEKVQSIFNKKAAGVIDLFVKIRYNKLNLV